MVAPHYSHRQTSPLRYILPVLIAASLGAGWVWRAEFWAEFSMTCLAGLFVLIFLTMTTLKTEADGDSLLVKFGPLPLFSTHIPYEQIVEVQAARSRVIDGWGIHFIPGRGWTWSLWGFDCVDITQRTGTLRVGTDDAQNLASFLESRIKPV